MGAGNGNPNSIPGRSYSIYRDEVPPSRKAAEHDKPDSIPGRTYSIYRNAKPSSDIGVVHGNPNSTPNYSIYRDETYPSVMDPTDPHVANLDRTPYDYRANAPKY